MKPVRPLKITVTTTARMILPSQVGRLVFSIRNIGSFDVCLRTLPDVTIASGIAPGNLIKAGEMLQYSRTDQDDTEASYYAIADGGSSDCLVIS